MQLILLPLVLAALAASVDASIYNVKYLLKGNNIDPYVLLSEGPMFGGTNAFVQLNVSITPSGAPSPGGGKGWIAFASEDDDAFVRVETAASRVARQRRCIARWGQLQRRPWFLLETLARQAVLSQWAAISDEQEAARGRRRARPPRAGAGRRRIEKRQKPPQPSSEKPPRGLRRETAPPQYLGGGAGGETGRTLGGRQGAPQGETKGAHHVYGKGDSRSTAKAAVLGITERYGAMLACWGLFSLFGQYKALSAF